MTIPLDAGTSRPALPGEALESAREALATVVRFADRNHCEMRTVGGDEALAALGETASEALAAVDAALASGEQGWRADMENAPKDGTVINVVGRYQFATVGFPRYAAYLEEARGWFEMSCHAPVRVIVWAWRPRDAWPAEPAPPAPETRS